ncbi:hypothetical protein [Pseudoalteromonas ruthenica]|uniref:hypothetical protein n=1 Tax=Pseudoalteromonas ruthenica TaxID=151081 RepID=UPI00110AC378|nr:hypothetical protein [Pseudoalteromonas ruthenica]TMO87707.1 hypothetical protein CWC12_10540 [Pseudoalteromonas ruthenica]TMP21512.1 hypothetical protein CWC06_18365 [Pseudoalteromonas ruthenica]
MSKKTFESLALAASSAPVLMFESVSGKDTNSNAQQEKQEPEEITETNMFESLEEPLMMEAISKAAISSIRSNAMAAVFTYADEGFTTAEELDSMAVGIADIDEDGDVSESEQEDYEQALNAIAQALEHIGVSESLITSALSDDSDEAAEEIALHIANFADDVEDEDKYIAEYAVREPLMMEAMRKVVRDGKVKWVKKPLRKRRMSSAQRAALKKARRKANTGAAKRARSKSMRTRKKAGLK